mmetsp:Transcript_89854/g.256907  ORF Transcript_89854/g.256907 Transcript_89854/m.256907 type:complete len:145 (-) Transcript_89854:168-602(-)
MAHTLTHELVHAFDQCRAHANWSNLVHQVSSVCRHRHHHTTAATDRTTTPLLPPDHRKPRVFAGPSRCWPACNCACSVQACSEIRASSLSGECDYAEEFNRNPMAKFAGVRARHSPHARTRAHTAHSHPSSSSPLHACRDTRPV